VLILLISSEPDIFNNKDMKQISKNFILQSHNFGLKEWCKQSQRNSIREHCRSLINTYCVNETVISSELIEKPKTGIFKIPDILIPRKASKMPHKA
jgi:hypothetical protein